MSEIELTRRSMPDQLRLLADSCTEISEALGRAGLEGLSMKQLGVALQLCVIAEHIEEAGRE